MKENSNVIFEIRNILDCSWEMIGKEAARIGYSAAIQQPESVNNLKYEAERIFSELNQIIKENDLDFKIIEISLKDGKIWLQGPSKEAIKILDYIRKIFISDSYDYRRYIHLEIEQTGPGKDEVKIFGPKGPAKSSSDISLPKSDKTPCFDANGEDAVTYAPFLLQDMRDDESPEVRLEFFDWEMLAETLQLDDRLEIDGGTLEDIMTEIIDREKLLKDTHGTHEGGYFDNSDSNAVLLHFNTLRDAISVAEYFIKIFTDKKQLRKLLESHNISID